MSRNNTQALHSILFIGLLLFSWHENFYGVTSKEIQASNGGEASITSQITGGSILSTEEQKEILSIWEEMLHKVKMAVLAFQRRIAILHKRKKIIQSIL